jgi:hypothetical protein
MAIDLGTTTITVSKQERTWRLEIFTEKGQDPSVRAHREMIETASDGTFKRERSGVTVERSLSAVATETFQIGGHTYTGGEIAMVLAAIADTWRGQDEAAAAAD